jgi:hypothetical protein
MSQFDGLLEIAKPKKTDKKEKPKKAEKVPPTPPPERKNDDAKPLGKSRDEHFTQTSIYIKRDTQIGIKSKLLTDKKKRDFSDLVEELLSSWLNKN